jgi:hypothetical protein
VGTGLHVDVEGPGKQRGPRHVRGRGVEQPAHDAVEVLGDRTFGIATTAPSMLRPSVVAETGSAAGMTGPLLSRGGGRSPVPPRGSFRPRRGDESSTWLRGADGTKRGASPPLPSM